MVNKFSNIRSSITYRLRNAQYFFGYETSKFVLGYWQHFRVQNVKYITGYETANLFWGTKQPIYFGVWNSQFIFGYKTANLFSVTKQPICFRLRNGISYETTNFFWLRNVSNPNKHGNAFAQIYLLHTDKWNIYVIIYLKF